VVALTFTLLFVPIAILSVYEVTSELNAGLKVPGEMTRLESVASELGVLLGGGVDTSPPVPEATALAVTAII